MTQHSKLIAITCLVAIGALFALPFAVDAQEQDSQCQAWLERSPCVEQGLCTQITNETEAVVIGDRLLCNFALKYHYPEWHPDLERKRKIWYFKAPEQTGGPLNRWAIHNTRLCVDGLWRYYCDEMTHDNFTKEYRPAMVDHIVKAKRMYPGVECKICAIGDPNCNPTNFFAPYYQRQHHCRWDGMISKIQDERPDWLAARTYAQSIVDKHGWANWKTMVRLIEGKKR